MTLRRVKEGWPAAGLLTPLYEKAGGRDQLADKAGASRQTLSAVNNGRQNLGLSLARRLISVVPGTTLTDLGAPEEAGDPKSQGILDRLEELEDRSLTVEDLRPVFQVLAALATGRRSEALRVLKEAGVVPG